MTYDIEAGRSRCKRYRTRILEISQQVQALHVAPAFSCMEITDVIYNELMRWPEQTKSPDVFVMSKGHGCMSQYVILEDRGVLEKLDLDNYCKPEGRLGAHPDYGVPGIEASTGSLGHGMGLVTGMAYGERMIGGDGIIYSILSDGECQEGSTWEAAMMAGNKFLENLIVFVDNNDFSGLERMSEGHQAFYPLQEKFEAFGFEGITVDGHDAEAILNAVRERKGGRPMAVICKTIKGKGVSYMEHVPIWHYRSPNQEEYAQALKELAEA